MNLKIKKVIAREGLIILSLLVVSLSFFFIDEWVKSKKSEYKMGAIEIELVKDIPQKEKRIVKNKEHKEGEMVSTAEAIKCLQRGGI